MNPRQPEINILLVDDRPDGLLTLEAVLAQDCYRLVKASSGPDALKHLLNEDFAVILLDVQMPGLSGFDTASLIKMRERSRRIPIIFMTAISKEEQFVYRGYQEGAVDYIFKPFDPYILRSKVAIFADLYLKNVQLAEQSRLLNEQTLAQNDLEHRLRYSNLAQAIPHIIWKGKEVGSFEYVNKAWNDTTGQSPNASLGEGWQLMVEPQNLHSFLDLWKKAAHDQSLFEVEIRIYSVKDDVWKWHLVRMHPEKTPEGEFSGWIGTATQIHDRIIAERSLRVLSEASRILFHVFDLDKTIAEFANLIAQELNAQCTIKLTRESESTTISSERILPIENQIKTYECNLKYRNFQFGTLWVALPLSSFKDGSLSLVDELAHRCSIALDNARLYSEACKAIQVRDDFLSIASHELKTPLTPLKLQATHFRKIFNEGRLAKLSPEFFQKMLKTTERQVDRLIRLVDEMLDLSRVQSGQMTFDHGEFDLYALTQEIIERFHDQLILEKSAVTLKGHGPITIWGDKFRIEQVIMNLISNALKYGEGKPFEIELNARDNDRVLLSVTDYGIGIAEEDQERIFDRFERAASASQFGGLGLGLFIVRQIVEKHQGSIRVESRLGHGSRFTVELPKTFSSERAEEPVFAAAHARTHVEGLNQVYLKQGF